jgi:hypothetical protein
VAATYDPTTPTLRDHIRKFVADRHTNEDAGAISGAILQDETIDAELGLHSWNDALANCADAIASYYARLADEYEQADGIRAKWVKRVDDMRDLAKRARAGGIPEPGADGGLSTGVAVGALYHSLPGYRNEVEVIDAPPFVVVDRRIW